MSIIKKIYSENDVYQTIEALSHNREKRNKLNGFLFEGVRNINNAIKYGWKINSFIYSKDKKLSDWARDILKNSKAKNHYELPFNLLKKLSFKEETSELLSIAEMPVDDFKRIKTKTNLMVIVFDRPVSPGNLGTLIRSADAFGVDGLVVTGHAVDVYEPETIRAATGSLFSLPVVRKPSHKELIPWLTELKNKFDDLQIIGTDEKGSVRLDEHNFVKPTILLVGNETWGLSSSYKELCDAMIKIPMKGSASSLNVSCASSIVLYEIYRQRGFNNK